MKLKQFENRDRYEDIEVFPEDMNLNALEKMFAKHSVSITLKGE